MFLVYSRVNWLWVGGDFDSKFFKVINVYGYVYSVVSVIVYSIWGIVLIYYSRYNIFIL